MIRSNGNILSRNSCAGKSHASVDPSCSVGTKAELESAPCKPQDTTSSGSKITLEVVKHSVENGTDEAAQAPEECKSVLSSSDSIDTCKASNVNVDGHTIIAPSISNPNDSATLDETTANVAKLVKKVDDLAKFQNAVIPLMENMQSEAEALEEEVNDLVFENDLLRRLKAEDDARVATLEKVVFRLLSERYGLVGGEDKIYNVTQLSFDIFADSAYRSRCQEWASENGEFPNTLLDKLTLREAVIAAQQMAFTDALVKREKEVRALHSLCDTKTAELLEAKIAYDDLQTRKNDQARLSVKALESERNYFKSRLATTEEKEKLLKGHSSSTAVPS